MSQDELRGLHEDETNTTSPPVDPTDQQEVEIQKSKGTIEDDVRRMMEENNRFISEEAENKKERRRRNRALGSLGRSLLTLVNTGDRTNARRERSRQNVPDIPDDDEDDEDLAANAAKWSRRRDIPLAILGWIFVVYIVLIGASHIGSTLLLLAIAALFAYALAPAVSFFERFLPRVLAILLIYLLVLGGLGTVLYFVARTAVDQVNSLTQYVTTLISTGDLNKWLNTLGISNDMINSVLRQGATQAQGAVANVVPFITGLLSSILDIIIVMVLSIYFLIDGGRVVYWLRNNSPRRVRGRVYFGLNTLQRIVGGYIRGQLFLCSFIGVLVGVGMTIIGVPYALLLGVLSFFLEFIPILGTLTSGVICVLLALTKGPVIAVIVLAYFIVVHILEGDVIGPRIVGRAVGLHPIVSMAALIAGSELFGIWGALFGSPVAGVLQALLIAVWLEWRERHPQDFQNLKRKVADKAEEHVAEKTLTPETAEHLLP